MFYLLLVLFGLRESIIIKNEFNYIDEIPEFDLAQPDYHISEDDSGWFDEIIELDLAHPNYYISKDKSEYIKEYCARTETFIDKEFCKSHGHFSKC